MIKLLNNCVIPFGFRKGKTENFSYQLRPISIFLVSLLNARDRKNTFIVDCAWRESRLPSLTIVLLCLVLVGLSQLSWAVRYLDKPRWRALMVGGYFRYTLWVNLSFTFSNGPGVAWGRSTNTFVTHSFIDSFLKSSFVEVSVWRRHVLMVEDGAFSHKKDYVTIV